MKVSLTKAGERATSAFSCRRVSVNVQRCSVQYKGYNLVGVTTVEECATIGTTALVYWQLHSSIHTDAVQGYWSTPDWSDCRQGCRQVSTALSFTARPCWDLDRSHFETKLCKCKIGITVNRRLKCNQKHINIFFLLGTGCQVQSWNIKKSLGQKISYCGLLNGKRNNSGREKNLENIAIIRETKSLCLFRWIPLGKI